MGPQFSDNCIGCAICVDMCPGDVLEMNASHTKPVVVYPDECWYCGVCRLECSVDAVTYQFPIKMIRL